MRILWIFLLLFWGCSGQTADKIVLADNGQSKYVIQIGRDTPKEIADAAKEFQTVFHQISQVRLPVETGTTDAPRVIIGGKKLFDQLGIALSYTELKKDGFVIKGIGKNIGISGVNTKGVINGVYFFMRYYLGCAYYAEEAVVIPSKKKVVLPTDLKTVKNPAFDIRIILSSQGYSKAYRKWNLLDIPPRDNKLWLKPWVHTTTQSFNLKWAKYKPERYTFINGKPMDINYKNEELVRILTKRLKKRLKEEPYVKYISVSQADRAIAVKPKDEKLSADVVYPFVNKIAKHFPDKTIVSLAYQFSRTPPTSVRPRDNVMVIVCNTNVNRARAVNPKNDFFDDLAGWQEFGVPIMVWDYMYNEHSDLMPYPNFYLMQKSIQNYKEKGVHKLILQLAHSSSAEFERLRSYLLSKLMWDPKLDVNAVMEEFLKAYYGDAAPYMKKYIKELTSRYRGNKKQKYLYRNKGPGYYRKSYLSPKALKEYGSLFQQAKKAVKNDETIHTRIDRQQQCLRYATLEIYKPILQKKDKGMRTVMSEKIRVKNRTKKRTTEALEIKSKKDYKALLNEFILKAEKYDTTHSAAQKNKSIMRYKKQLKID